MPQLPDKIFLKRDIEKANLAFFEFMKQIDEYSEKHLYTKFYIDLNSSAVNDITPLQMLKNMPQLIELGVFLT